MKKLYVLLLSTLAVIGVKAQNGQIQNGGFENWTNETLFDYTTSWGCSNTDQFQGVATTLKSTDAQIGTYSAQITAAEVGSNPDTTFGYVFHGTLGAGGGGPEAGIPYTSTFNEVRFQYKSDLPIGDTMYLLVIRYDAMGNPTDQLILPAAYGVHSTWTQGSVAVLSNSQTTLFLAFIIGDPFSNNTPTPGVWARIDNVQMYNTGMPTVNVPDPSFENWASLTTETPDNWFTLNEMLAGMSVENVNKSTNSNSGMFAAELTTIQYPPMIGDTIPGIISWGPIDFNNFMSPFIPAPYNATPTTFSGTYNYSPVNGDEGSIQVIFFAGGSPVASANQTCVPTMGYNTFSLSLMFGGTPDSIILLAFSGNNPGSVLLVDDLSLSGGNVGIEEFENLSVSVFPNPATDNVMIKADGIYAYEMFDLSGKIVRSESNLTGAHTINISDLNAGSYMIRLSNSFETTTHQLVKQ